MKMTEDRRRMLGEMLAEAATEMERAQAEYDRIVKVVGETREKYDSLKRLVMVLGGNDSNSEALPIVAESKPITTTNDAANPIVRAIDSVGQFASRSLVKAALSNALTDAKVSEMQTAAYRKGYVARLRYGMSKQLVAHGLPSWVVRRNGKLELRDQRYYPDGSVWAQIDRSQTTIEFLGDTNSIESV